jgi:hypothetical protein
MKPLLLPILLVTMACCRAEPILPEEAKDHIGENASGNPADRMTLLPMSQTKFNHWLSIWDPYATPSATDTTPDTVRGEKIGWIMTPSLNGFYYGYLATGDTKWVGYLVNWADRWIQKATIEPDGYKGWPAVGASGTLVDGTDAYYADSLLGEAMALRPIVLMAREILNNPTLSTTYGAKAQSYIQLAEKTFEKWESRGAWRETSNGGIWVVLPFGINRSNNTWTSGYSQRFSTSVGFSVPNNKANHIARWHLALYDATGKSIYKDRANKWFQLMKSRLKLTTDGIKFQMWNYWEPAGAWDYLSSGQTKHWVGVHTPGYYFIDTEGIVDAYEHSLVFHGIDLGRLIATALAENRYWTALVPYNTQIQNSFESSNKPNSWGGLTNTPWYLSLQKNLVRHHHDNVVSPSPRTAQAQEL